MSPVSTQPSNTFYSYSHSNWIECLSMQSKLMLFFVYQVSTYQRSFSAAASDLWNDLPLHVKNCQTLAKLKSILKVSFVYISFLTFLLLFVV